MRTKLSRLLAAFIVFAALEGCAAGGGGGDGDHGSSQERYKPETYTCMHCRAELRWEASETERGNAPAPFSLRSGYEREYTCPKCKKTNLLVGCYSCDGHVVVEHYGAFTCPHCGKRVGAVKCPHCGLAIRTGEDCDWTDCAYCFKKKPPIPDTFNCMHCHAEFKIVFEENEVTCPQCKKTNVLVQCFHCRGHTILEHYGRFGCPRCGKRAGAIKCPGCAHAIRTDGDGDWKACLHCYLTLGTVSIGANGAVVDRPGLKIVFPPPPAWVAGSRADVQKIASPPNSVILSQRRISNAFTLRVEQWNSKVYDPNVTDQRAVENFESPVTVTLSFDPKLLPPNAKKEDIYPVMARGSLYERLKADKIDLQKHEISFRISRAYPLVNACGEPDTTGVSLLACVDLSKPVPLETKLEQKEVTIFTDPKIKEKAAPLADSVLKTVSEIRKSFVDKKFRVPTEIQVYLVPMEKSAQGQASRGSQIFVNLDLWNPAAGSFILAHEMFHLVQQVSDRSFDHLVPLEAGIWAAESTAQWMAWTTYPKSPALDEWVGELPVALGFREFFRGEEPGGEDVTQPAYHAYHSAVFWAYLETRYDATALIRQLYRPSEKGSHDREHVGEVRDLVSVLDQILLETPDKTDGQRRSLKGNYGNFLMHYYYKKDFEPLKNHHIHDNLGDPGVIFEAPREMSSTWDLPGGEGPKRITKRWDTKQGPGFSIVHTVDIHSKAKGDDKGNLTLTLEVGERRAGNRKDAMIIVFTYTGNHKYRNVLAGTADSPVILKSWEKLSGVLVWMVDGSRTGENRLKLTAQFKSTAESKPVEETPTETDWAGTWVVTATCKEDRIVTSGTTATAKEEDGDRLGKTESFEITFKSTGSGWEQIGENPCLCWNRKGIHVDGNRMTYKFLKKGDREWLQFAERTTNAELTLRGDSITGSATMVVVDPAWGPELVETRTTRYQYMLRRKK